jgi:hypothetical protein
MPDGNLIWLFVCFCSFPGFMHLGKCSTTEQHPQPHCWLALFCFRYNFFSLSIGVFLYYSFLSPYAYDSLFIPEHSCLLILLYVLSCWLIYLLIMGHRSVILFIPGNFY